MRVAILTFHRALNCGAMLQAWALKRVLEMMGHVAFFPDCNVVGVRRRFSDFPKRWWRVRPVLSWARNEIFALGTEDARLSRFAKFSKTVLRPTMMTAQELPQRCDTVVVGSDQVWNPGLALEDIALFFGETLPPEFPKIAYAASIGDAPLQAESLKRLQKAALRFHALSLREPWRQEPLYDRRGRPPIDVVDPTLLLSRQDYLPIAAPKRLVKGRYLLVYALGVSAFVRQIAKRLGKALGLKVVFIEVYRYGRWGASKGTALAVSPDRFLAYFRDAEYVLASSFHGTVFSLIFGKRFLSLLEKEGSTPSRPANLLRQLGISERLVVKGVSEEGLLERLQCPLPEALATRLVALREVSKTFLAHEVIACEGK